MTTELAALKVDGPETRGVDANFALLQAMVFMAIIAENSGPVQSRNTSWLAEAVSLASYLNLHQSHRFDMGDPADGNSGPKVARRLWLSLLVLDRFHAISTASPMLIAEVNSYLIEADAITLGIHLYPLVRKWKKRGFRLFYKCMITFSRYLARARPCIPCYPARRPPPHSDQSSRASH